MNVPIDMKVRLAQDSKLEPPVPEADALSSRPTGQMWKGNRPPPTRCVPKRSDSMTFHVKTAPESIVRRTQAAGSTEKQR